MRILALLAFSALFLLGALEVLLGFSLSPFVLYHRKIQDLQSYWPVASLFGVITVVATLVVFVSSLVERKK